MRQISKYENDYLKKEDLANEYVQRIQKKNKLVIIGAGEMAEIAYEYFTYDSDYEVCGFAVEKQFMDKDSLFGLRVYEFEKICCVYPPSEYMAFVALSSTKVNRYRTRLYMKCKDLGYECATYVSSRAFVWHNVEVGENSFIFENNTVQYNVKIGNNVILWSGNHIGHRTEIDDNCFITSHAVISGYCHVGKNCFIGVNATVGDYVNIADDVFLAAGALTVKDLNQSGAIYIGSPAKSKGNIYEKYCIKRGN